MKSKGNGRVRRGLRKNFAPSPPPSLAMRACSVRSRAHPHLLAAAAVLTPAATALSPRRRPRRPRSARAISSLARISPHLARPGRRPPRPRPQSAALRRGPSRCPAARRAPRPPHERRIPACARARLLDAGAPRWRCVHLHPRGSLVPQAPPPRPPAPPARPTTTSSRRSARVRLATHYSATLTPRQRWASSR